MIKLIIFFFRQQQVERPSLPLKMSKKLTKISMRDSRQGLQAKTTTPSQILNNSDEDFVPVTGDKPYSISKINETAPPKDICTASELKSASSSSATMTLPSCPFCQKTFVSGQKLSRASHLKSCGNQLGLDTNQLLQIRKLEDKQAQEWKDLNLPKITNGNTTTITNRSS